MIQDQLGNRKDNIAAHRKEVEEADLKAKNQAKKDAEDQITRNNAMLGRKAQLTKTLQ